MLSRSRIDGPYVLLIRTNSTPKLLADSASWKSAGHLLDVNKRPDTSKGRGGNTESV